MATCRQGGHRALPGFWRRCVDEAGPVLLTCRLHYGRGRGGRPAINGQTMDGHAFLFNAGNGHEGGHRRKWSRETGSLSPPPRPLDSCCSDERGCAVDDTQRGASVPSHVSTAPRRRTDGLQLAGSPVRHPEVCWGGGRAEPGHEPLDAVDSHGARPQRHPCGPPSYPQPPLF